MKRKINRVGQNTLTVSIPSKWAKEHHIKAGQEVEVITKGKNIVISKIGHIELGEIVVDIPKRKDFLRRLITNPYVMGYNIIRVNFKEPEVMDRVQKTTDLLLLGFEVVKQGDDYCIIKNVAQGVESEFEVLFNRQFMVTISFGKELYDSFRDQDFDRLPQILRYEETLNKLGFFCRRMLNTVGYKYAEKTRAMYKLTTLFEIVGDFFRYITVAGIQQKPKLSKKTLHFFKEVLELLEKHSITIKRLEKEKLHVSKKKREFIRDEGAEMLKKPNPDAFYIHNLTAIGEMIHHMTEEVI